MPLETHPYPYADDRGTPLAGYLALPETPRTRPGVLLGPDWSGPTEPTQRIAEQIAMLGYPCLLLDVYGAGVRGDPQGDNSALMDPLLADRGLVRRRAKAGLQAALSHPRFDSTRIAALGYCFGGLVVLDLARANPSELVAVATMHAALHAPTDLDERPVSARLLVCHGWSDPMVPREDLVAFCDEMTKADADFRVHLHGHAMHAYSYPGLNAPERGLAYNEAAATRSWEAVVGFLTEALTPVDGASP